MLKTKISSSIVVGSSPYSACYSNEIEISEIDNYKEECVFQEFLEEKFTALNEPLVEYQNDSSFEPESDSKSVKTANTNQIN